MKHLIIFTLFTILLTNQLYAEGKKTIQVRFNITEQQYKNFYESETSAIEKECSAQMVDFLNKTFGFFLFNLESNQQVLHIELTDNEQNLSTHSTLKEVGFKVYITHQENLSNGELVYWVFRPVESYILPLPDVKDEFIDEVIQSFKIGVLNNKEALVKNILSKVEVASDFYFIQDKKWFILPLTEKETNIANSSVFLIITSVPDELIGLKESEIITKVVGNIQKELAIETNHRAYTYPKGSLVVEKDKNDINDIPNELVVDSAVLKKIFILKHLPFKNSDIEIVTPQSLISATNQ